MILFLTIYLSIKRSGVQWNILYMLGVRMELCFIFPCFVVCT